MDYKIFRSLDKAQELAADLNAEEEDGWTYEVVDCKNGLGYIQVYDEDKNLMGGI
jgi:hypothetical protein